ncbi:MAG: DUF5336 domain-containing protein [Mycobacterium sp.]|uniref:hypothetical protein n=1 Tax=Mycobacterium sp. TaxID=1785 RepID=UPI001EB6AF44|nr:hypothetical protein [Mycobacterium sp.]MBW0017839.1 DUF5336 domain-containing protein [Mycobacterium sp.]
MSDYPGGFNPPDQNPPNQNPQWGPNPGGEGGYNAPPTHGQPQGGYGQQAPPPGYQFPGAGAGGSVASLDLGAITPGGLMAAVGGLLYFILSFCPWYAVDVLYIHVSVNAWHESTGMLSALIFLLVAVAFGVKALKVLPANIPLEIIALALAGLGDLLFLIAFLAVPNGASRDWGMWIALLAALVITAGAVLQFLKAGGIASAQRSLGMIQQRAAGPQGNYPPGAQPPHSGGYPQQPGGYPQQPGGYPPPGDYPPQGGYPPPGSAG